MSKELEALKNIVNEISNYKLHGLGDKNWLGIQDVLKDIDTIEKALTPPTEQELCEELNEWFETKVCYKPKHKTFYYRKSTYNIELVSYYKDTKSYVMHFEFGEPLPPRLITMIGRFYEGKVRK